MADEITFKPVVTLANGNLEDTFSPGKDLIDQSASGKFSTTQNIGTTEETVTISNLTTHGYAYIRNLDVTNYIEYGIATGSYFGKLKAGEVAVFRMVTGLTWYFKANTAACDVLVTVYED